MASSKEEFVNLIANQKALLEQINVLKRNYKKTSAERRLRGYVSKRIETLDGYWKSFCENDSALRHFSQFNESEYATNDQFESVDELYSVFSGELAEVLYTLDNPIAQQSASGSNTQSNPQSSQVHLRAAPTSDFRLPQITLPTFSGDYASWSAFRDMFVSLIHSNNALTKVQKLHYLKCNLRGQAANLLRNTTITNDNYDVAWKALETRYANKRALIDVQLRTLLNQQTHNAENATNIRELIDVTQECLNAIIGLEINVDNWDPLLLFILVQKLSKETRKAWELEQQGQEELSTFDEFTKFLENRFRMLESLADGQITPVAAFPKLTRHVKSHASHLSSTKVCPLCNGPHYLRVCERFLGMNVSDRRDVVKQQRLCFNCLVQGHLVSECRNRMNCQKCNRNHHTLLHHIDIASNTNIQPTSPSTNQQAESSVPNPFASAPNKPPFTSLISSVSSFNPSKVLLATALIHVVSSTGQIIPLRALIDQGSEVTLVTTNAAQLLRLKYTAINLPLSGIGQASAGKVRSLVQLDIRSQHQKEFALRATALVLNNITGLIPRSLSSGGDWPLIAKLKLADPSFEKPGKIDVLLGADVYKHIILPGIVHGEKNSPLAQHTVFGWILSGNIETTSHVNIESQISSLHTCIDIDQRLKSFWELEEVSSNNPHHTEEENQCEEHFANTHSKSSDGRYVVRLPLRTSSQLGESRTSALHRFLQTERSLCTKPSRKSSYVEFMREYIALGHMKISNKQAKTPPYVIPHHAVFKESSSTTKTRVVFDASNKSSNGKSLNEVMLIGPKIQDDLSTLLTRWRKYPVAFTADIEKMYRQIWVHPEDQHLQHVLWRESPDAPMLEYTLQTVTYGTSCAPYLAVRTLRQLAIDNKDTYPEASEIIKHDFYVDDLISGAYTIADATFIRRQLCSLMSSAGLNLRKWVSNHSEVLNEIPIADREIQYPLHIDINNTVTALGIIWNPSSDSFNFNLNLPTTTERPPTKRSILSDISKIFDPLGWLSPLIIRAKILMQKLWFKGVSWDDPLTESTIKEWNHLRDDLFSANTISIDRWISHHNGSLELHGFSDASMHAYAAAIYTRVKQVDGKYKVTLLTAKTRVAPSKQISIPRLELCGAVLLAELLQKAQNDLNIRDCSVFAWTDSTIVLHWLRAEPRTWKTFIANRVSTIQQIIPSSKWRHVPTLDNPTDGASRGMKTESLRTHSLWWHGPTFLYNEPNAWPSLQSPTCENETDQNIERRMTCNVTTTEVSATNDMITLLNKFSSIGRLIRVTSYCKRFIAKLIAKSQKLSLPNYSERLSAKELQESLQFWLLISQKNSFQKDISRRQKNQPLSSKSKLLCLNPFLDEQKILRVGGRLHNSTLSYNEKHPIILSNHCHLSNLIIRQFHIESMHGGIQLVLGMIRKRYWIINARNKVRSQIYRCVTCHRYKAECATQLMGNLPEPRINITRAFTHTGVDYAGPVDIRMSKGRGNSSYKGYIALFICLCTKAIHIEAVSDLTSMAFIAAYRRFVSRRGLPAHVYSDNGTNFVGAAKHLRKAHESSMLMVTSQVIDNATKNATQWHFTPPSSPHFGGLWEAGVKSMKFHLKRTIGDSKLTYEELSTLLTQIESCLNSRPLAPITSDPSDLTALTPGHFLIGDALLSPPDQANINDNISLLSRWKLVQRYFQTISNRWKTEYMSRLQQRPKWVKQMQNIQINDLVLIKDLNTSPCQWPLARVIATHPGDDNLVRVVTLQTSNGVFKRCISKICPLPI